jgi:hypothetical protein
MKQNKHHKDKYKKGQLITEATENTFALGEAPPKDPCMINTWRYRGISDKPSNRCERSDAMKS